MLNKNKLFIQKLRSSGLRPTRQRVEISKFLFSRKKTFHFTINDLFKILQKRNGKKISLATIYNTVHSFEKKGYLKEISVNKDKSYFDTNIKSHHHFYDESTKELTDIDYNQVQLSRVPIPPKGKKIKNLEVVIRVQK